MPYKIVAEIALNGQQLANDSKAAFSAFNRNALDSAQQVKSAFQSNLGEIQSMVRSALSAPANAAGALDLNVSGLREGATAARNQALALREVAIAAERAAGAAGDTSQATRLYVAAAQAAANEGEDNARALFDQVTAYERLQTELNRSVSGVVRLNAANDEGAHSAASHKFALQDIGYQLQDIAVQAAGGASPFLILAQQGGQLASAFSGLGGKAEAFAKFMGSGFGVALGVAIPIIGLVGQKLLETKDALDQAKIGSDGLSDAQSVLGRMFDLTSGKLEHQNDLLRLNARLTAINLRGDAIKEQDSSTKTFRNSGEASLSYQAAAVFSQTPGTSPISRLGALNAQAQAVRDLLTSVQSGAITKEVGLQQADKLDFRGLKVTKTEFEQALIDSASADAKKKIADAIDKSLDSNTLDPSLRKDSKPKKPKSQEGAIRESESAAELIARINAEWDDTPKLIDKANLETLKLDNLIKDLGRRKPPGFKDLIADAEKAKQAIQDGLSKPYNDFIKQQNDAFQVSKLLAQGHTDEAAALQKVLEFERNGVPLTQAKKDAILDTVQALRAEAEAQARLNQARQQDLQALDNIRGIVTSTLAGTESLSRAPKDILQAFKTLQGQQLFDKLFGDAFQELQDQISGVSTVKDASAAMKEALDSTHAPLQQFSDAVTNAANAVAGAGAAAPGISPADLPSVGGGSSSGATGIYDPVANEILVTAAKNQGEAATKMLSAVDLFDKAGAKISDSLGKLGIHLPKALADNLGTLLQGASYGGLAGGIFSKITGSKGSSTGSAIGGALGDVAGKAIGKSLGSALGSLGQFAGPLGAIAGGILGGVIGGLFKKVPHGASTITATDGTLSASAGFGNSKKAEAAAVGEANSVITGIQQVAQQLGAQITGSPGITVGTYKGKYRVNTQGTKLGGSSKPVPGLTDFGDDQAAAIQYAIQQSIQKGVISGISQASINILKSGQDLQTAITKATAIESIPKQLKGLIDPVGEAIDELNAQFNTYVADLKEGGATTEQMAQAQQLYNLQLEQVKANTASASQTLKDFLKTLNIGSSSPLSLRDQEASAKAALQPFLADIASGKSINQSGYQDAAQAFLDIERQLYGSTDKYFEAFNQIQDATNKAISAIDNVASIASPAGASDPFPAQTATATQKTADATQTSAEILAQQTQLLASNNALLQQLLGRVTNDKGTVSLSRLFAS